MSRIGKKPIPIPEGIKVVFSDPQTVTVRGPKESLSVSLPRGVSATLADNVVVVTSDVRLKNAGALWGLSRQLVANAVVGVTQGFSKVLTLEGIGYRATLDGSTLVLNVGFSHPVRVEALEGITFAVEKNAVTISGADKQLVGQVAASIREIRKPEPYKGKGIRYVNEIVRRKAGKKAAGVTK